MTEEEHRLIQGVLRDHPTRPFYDGPRKEHKLLPAREAIRLLLPAREAIRLLREAAEEEKGRQLMIHADGHIW